MASSNRRLGRSPARRSDVMELDLAERTYVLHHGALGHDYRLLPEHHHLEVEDTPRAYFSRGGHDRFPWMQEEPTSGTPRRLLRVARWVDD